MGRKLRDTIKDHSAHVITNPDNDHSTIVTEKGHSKANGKSVTKQTADRYFV